MSEFDDHHQHGSGEASHHFDPDHAEKFLEPERLDSLHLDELLEELGLTAGERVLDVGTGAGALIPRLSDQVGEAGSVVGCDVSEDMLEYARRYLGDPMPANVKLIQNQPDELPFPDQDFDRILMVCLLHELSCPVNLLNQVQRVLKPGGLAVALDWRHEQTNMGPPVDHRLPRDRAIDLFKQAGFDAIEYQQWKQDYFLLRGSREKQ